MWKPLKRDLKLANTQNSRQHLTDAVFFFSPRCAGYYCSGRAASPTPSDGLTGNICPVEHYCPSGSTSPLVCPDGMYSNTTGTIIHLTQPGHDMIYHTGLNSPPFPFFLSFFLQPKGAEVCKDCPVGTYCLSGEGIQLCPAGHYCLGGGVEGILPCPPGTYSPQFGLSQVEQCLICPAGESVVIWLLPLLLSQTCKVFQETLL